jgi:hypothetical protein
MPALFLSLFCLAASVGVGLGLFLRHRPHGENPHLPFVQPALLWTAPIKRPQTWLVVRGRSLLQVKSALAVANAKPWPVADALDTEQRIFISPPVKGWVLVVGTDLPDPAEDVDACFRFIQNASRRLGHVQFFSANPVLHQHAWIRAEKGKILRAYAWAGRTLWKQGKRTPAEEELEVTCQDYCVEPNCPFHPGWETAAANTEKVPLIAARWSLDPGNIEPALWQAANGLAGEVGLRF